jgi:hypothetical protein
MGRRHWNRRAIRPPPETIFGSQENNIPYANWLYKIHQARRTENPQMDYFWLGRIATELKHNRTILA